MNTYFKMSHMHHVSRDSWYEAEISEALYILKMKAFQAK